LRSLVAEIRGALDTHSKEEVAEILTYIFKEYVVEGPLPLASSAATVVAARSEIEGLSFAQLISWLQLHHDAPELALFDVQGERVSVRVGGRLAPLEAQAARPEPLPPQPTPQPAAPPPPVATTTATVARMPAQAARPAQPAAPPPAQPAAAQPAAQPAAAQPAQPAAAQPAAKTSEEGDSSRFSLLEVD
jgi:hypothetical protein